MRKILSGLAVVFLVPVVTAAAAAAAPPPKVDVCHHDADHGTHELLSVSSNAAHAHEHHGDGVPGGAVPGMEGATFDEACGIVEAGLAKAGCFANFNRTAYFATNGENPQMTGGSTPVYLDAACTDATQPTSMILAFVWDETDTAARATCINDLGGGAIGLTSDPNLFLCIVRPS